jgi:hypothetical protein
MFQLLFKGEWINLLQSVLTGSAPCRKYFILNQHSSLFCLDVVDKFKLVLYHRHKLNRKCFFRPQSNNNCSLKKTLFTNWKKRKKKLDNLPISIGTFWRQKFKLKEYTVLPVMMRVDVKLLKRIAEIIHHHWCNW